MSRRLGQCLASVVGLALLAVAPWPTTADPPPRPADPGGADDVQDLLFLSEARPYVFRLHLFIDGKPFTVRWTEQVLKVFNYLDRDGDGVLSKEEVTLAPAAQQMAQMFHGVPYNTVAFNDGSLFTEMDVDRDKKVTPVEFLNYYRQGVSGPAQLTAAPGRGAGADALTEMVFKILDVDKDGKLSKQELSAAEEVFRKYDQNDDEIITAQELTLGPALQAAAFPQVAIQQGPAPPIVPLGDSPFQLVPREEAPKRVTERLKLAKEILIRYDKDKNGKLNPAEIGLAKEIFDRFDGDKDGEWSALELLRWMIFEPDMEATARLGQVSPKDGLLDLAAGAETASRPGLNVRKGAVNALSIGMNDAQISLIRGGDAGRDGSLTDAVFQTYEQQFLAIDKEDLRYITKKQLAGGENPAFYQLFAIADHDGDGKLTEQELKEWVALATEGVGSVATISVADNGRAFFEMLDVNNDGRLTIRELRSAWARLAPYDHDGDGAITKEEIPRQFQVTVAEGGGGYNAAVQAAMPQAMAAPYAGPPRVERGPLWFRKMDVNGDGDVSPREFLGGLEDFKRIDTDGDGLISLEEAEAFDATMRAKKSDK